MRLAGSDSAEIDSISDDYSYAGIDTCALDGLCGTACPVGINTGDYIKHLRTKSIKNEKFALQLANNFALMEKAVGAGVTLGHFTEKVLGANGVKSILVAAEKFTGTKLPKWNKSIPHPTKNAPELRAFRGEKEFIYFSSCISRQLGVSNSKLQVTSSSNFQTETFNLSLSEALLVIARRANINLHVPENVSGHCCGMPFHSKGYTRAYQVALQKTFHQMWTWSEHGKYPIVIDTSSCTHTLRNCADELSPEDNALYQKLTILDGIEFLHDYVLPKLNLHSVEEEVVLHPNCSARRLGLDAKMLKIAQKCAKSASIPLNLGCCAFAGDRGLLFPELTASATEKETTEVLSRDYGGYYSSNITCEIGMSEATGKDYVSIVYLVEKASR
jgi:D-lactate dehydrogenase